MLKQALVVRLFLLSTCLLFILACGIPTPPAPVEELASLTPAEPPTASPNRTAAPTSRPTLPPTRKAILPPTATRKALPASQTPLPSLPDFAQTIYFGEGGAGGDVCAYPGYLPALFGSNPTFGVLPQQGSLCVWGAKFGQPFSLQLVSPDGSLHLGAEFLVDESSLKVNWLGAAPGAFNAVAYTSVDGTSIEIEYLWSLDLPNGKWQIFATGPGLNASGVLGVEDSFTEIPRIMLMDGHSTKEILPVSLNGSHAVLPNPDGSLDVLGRNFRPNRPVYLLVYQEADAVLEGDSLPPQASLVYAQIASSDAAGWVKARIPGALDPTKKYLLVGVDENTPVTNGGFLRLSAVGIDFFSITK